MLKNIFTGVVALCTAALLALGAWQLVERSNAQSTILLPQITGIAIPTTAGGTQIVGANPSRKFIEICNASVTNDLWIMPTSTSAAALPTLVAGGVGAYLVSQKPAAGATIGTAMNCYRTPSYAGQTGLSAGSAWLGLAVTGTANVTVYEY